MMLNIGAFDPALLGEWRQQLPASYRIIELVAERFNLPEWRLLGRLQTQKVAFARHVAMYLLREAGLTYPRIAQLLNKANHTTAIHGYNVIAARMAEQPAFRARIEALKEEVGG